MFIDINALVTATAVNLGLSVQPTNVMELFDFW